METAAAPVGEGLRERRRRETTLEICEAALDLFEEKGVARTTVDEIAARAGVSARTFFRLAGTKEDAVFIDDERFVAALSEVGSDGDDVAALTRALREVFVFELGRLHADAHARERFLRVRRLIGHEPSLLGAAIRRETTSSDRFIAEIAARVGLGELPVRAAIGVAALEMRTALDEWARCADRGETADLLTLHRDVQRLLGAAASAVDPED